MTDDSDVGEHILEVLEPLLRSCTSLVVSERTNLNHRGGGLRVTYEVMLNPGATTVHVDQEVTVERADAPRRRPSRPALPRAGRTLDP
ncbi:hypothetical protein KUF83_30400 [Streptomyces sp. BV286]|uniref:hypothetical protein n=1 Tax=Streptomyces sp. BV286 TaxID=2849672 RepID=UPI001C2E3D9E|nr:hypothetical protein [Streptomyces sp. BV286]MBV1940848.1 hypothetical protein [Streptomyces sp. BV286]